MRQYKIAAIPADGIGKEVIPAGIRVLKTLAEHEGTFSLSFETFPWGCDYYHEHGRMMAEDGLDILKGFDAIFFGAVGHPTVPDHITLWGLRLAICQGFDQYANVRPARILPGISSPLRGRGRRTWTGSSSGRTGGGVFGGRRQGPSRPARGSRHGGLGLHPHRGTAHHELRLRTGPQPPAQAADPGDQVQRAAPRHGDVGRDLRRTGEGLPRRHHRQDAGRRGHHAHGAQAAKASM